MAVRVGLFILVPKRQERAILEELHILHRRLTTSQTMHRSVILLTRQEYSIVLRSLKIISLGKWTNEPAVHSNAIFVEATTATYF